MSLRSVRVSARAGLGKPRSKGRKSPLSQSAAQRLGTSEGGWDEKWERSFARESLRERSLAMALRLLVVVMMTAMMDFYMLHDRVCILPCPARADIIAGQHPEYYIKLSIRLLPKASVRLYTCIFHYECYQALTGGRLFGAVVYAWFDSFKLENAQSDLEVVLCIGALLTAGTSRSTNRNPAPYYIHTCQRLGTTYWP